MRSAGIYKRKPVTNKASLRKSILVDKNLIINNDYKWLDYIVQKKKINLSFEYLIKQLYLPTCSSSLGVVRALFGLMMVIDIPDERGLANIDLRFGDPLKCQFPLFDWLKPLSLEYMGILYLIMWLGALGICFGLKFKISCLMFTIPYWYIYLLDKSLWNNHSYLYGLLSILFTFTCANYSFSVDAMLNSNIQNKKVPLWNYSIIRFQFFLLYFYAGVKKFDFDWIGGYSMTGLSLHWVFSPFRLVLNNEQIDFWIIHIFGFTFDLTVGFFLLISKTRPVAMLFSTAFHLMNSCMFHIGQFPYVCLVTTPIFCSFDWPQKLMSFLSWNNKTDTKNTPSLKEKEKNDIDCKKITWKQKTTCSLLGLYIAIQLFLPYSHFLTQGYNNWTNGLYGYSWDMMVQNWSFNVIIVKVVDNQSKKEFFIDPEAWVENTRFSKHADMVVQYARCLKKNLNSPEIKILKDILGEVSFEDISIYIDVWCSLNGRFQQRMFDPRQDLLKAEWSPFEKISWLMPLLTDLSPWRKNLLQLQDEVYSWSNHSNVLFFADFPGLYLENYINPEFTNVSVKVLQGILVLEQIDHSSETGATNITLHKGESSFIKEGKFHKFYTVSEEPSCFMFSFNNYSVDDFNNLMNGQSDLGTIILKEHFLDNLNRRIKNLLRSVSILVSCFKKLFFNIDIPKRNKQLEF